MLKRFMKYFIAVVLVILVSGISLAQNSASIFVCVSPEDSAQPSYTMAFQRTTAFGLLLPENADVVIYSMAEFASSLYTINTDANSGGYRTLERLAIIHSGTVIPADIDCGDQFQEELGAANYSTIPIPVSVNHALLIELGEAEVTDEIEETGDAEETILTDELTIRGVLALTFRPGNATEPATWFNFQILQISEVDPVIEFAVPSILPNTPFSVIANKTFSIGQSQIGVNPPQFPPNLQPSNPRQFVQSDLQTIFDLNLFNVMNEGSIRIYPESGVYGVYNGAYFRLSIPTDIPQRVFTDEVMVRALEGTQAATVLMNRFEDNPLRIDIPFAEGTGSIQGETTADVVRIEEGTGQLIVLEGSEEAIIQSWLVEPVE